MITAMVKMPDGKVLNKILAFNDEEFNEDRIIELANGNVCLIFKDGMRVLTHMSNVVIIVKDSQ